MLGPFANAPNTLATRTHLYNNFDALRLIAAWSVLFSHQFPVTATAAPDWMNVPMVGGAAVMTFFVISGYLVSLSWWSQPQFFAFAAKRALRIWPALIVVVLLCMLALGAGFTSLPSDAYFQQAGTWAYLRNIALDIQYTLPGVFANHPIVHTLNGSLWTIPIEVGCYVVLAIAGLFGLLKSRKIWAALCAAYLVWFLSSMTMDLTGSMHHAWEFPAYFAFGSLIAAFHTQFLQHRWACTAVATIVAVAAYALGFKYSALLLFLPSLLIAIGTLSTPVLSRAGRFGDVSYGVYLYAFPIQQSVYALWPGLGFASSLALVTVLSLLAGWISWRCVEAPALRLKSFLR